MMDERGDLFSTGRWTGTYSILSWNRLAVSRLLPSELVLGPNDLTGNRDEHPVYFMVGRQSDVSGSWPVMRTFGFTYNEAMILIPFVRFKDGGRDFIYMPRLYLNSWSPWALGVYVFGYEKVQKPVSARARSFQVTRDSGKPLWSGTFELLDKFDSKAVDEGYRKMAGIFSQPLVGFKSGICGRSAMASWMTFENELRTPAKTEIKFEDKLLTGNLFDSTYRFEGMDTTIANRSIHLLSDWTLSFPTSSFDRG